MTDEEWREMDPADFDKAVVFDREIRQRDNFVFLHQIGKPLDRVDFTNHQISLLPGCDSGYCFV